MPWRPAILRWPRASLAFFRVLLVTRGRGERASREPPPRLGPRPSSRPGPPHFLPALPRPAGQGDSPGVHCLPRRRDAGPQGSAAAAVSAPRSSASGTTPGSRAAGTLAAFRTESPGCARLWGAIDSRVHTSPLLYISMESPRFEGTPREQLPRGEATAKASRSSLSPFPSPASFCRHGLLLCTYSSLCLGSLGDR